MSYALKLIMQDMPDIQIDLDEDVQCIEDFNLDVCKKVYEDGWYRAYVSISETNIERIDFRVNGTVIGTVERPGHVTEGWNKCFFKRNDEYVESQKIFLLLYDLVFVSIDIYYKDSTQKTLFSPYFLCLSKNFEDTENITDMIKQLEEFENSNVYDCIFEESSRTNSLQAGGWAKHAYKSLGSYVKLLEEVLVIYQECFNYYTYHSKTKVTKQRIIKQYNKINRFDKNSFKWVINHPETLSEVSNDIGMKLNGANYIPISVAVDKSMRSYDVYENQVVVNFLYTIWAKTAAISKELQNETNEQNRIVENIQGSTTTNYKSSIITVKKIYISYTERWLSKLSQIEMQLNLLTHQYSRVFNLKPQLMECIPRNTKTFQQIIPYRKVYTKIKMWFEYGDYNLKREQLVLQMKSLDKLFEYFCYFKILDVLYLHGFEVDSFDKAVDYFRYDAPDHYYQNERDIPNTLHLSNGDRKVVVYYQPVIYTNKFMNGITMWRTNSHKGYYTPDFILKFSYDNQNPEYVVLDSKFSNRENIRRYSLDEVVKKYSSNCSIAVDTSGECSDTYDPCMVWILQGRIDENVTPVVDENEKSPLARIFRVRTSKGIISTNTVYDFNLHFWKRLKEQVNCLDTIE